MKRVNKPAGAQSGLTWAAREALARTYTRTARDLALGIGKRPTKPRATKRP